jgi:hypothetical protein
MKLQGFDIPDVVKCFYCEITAAFHHIASSMRKDGKRTIIYVCPYGHRTFLEVTDPSAKQIKVIEPRKKKSHVEI